MWRFRADLHTDHAHPHELIVFRGAVQLHKLSRAGLARLVKQSLLADQPARRREEHLDKLEKRLEPISSTQRFGYPNISGLCCLKSEGRVSREPNFHRLKLKLIWKWRYDDQRTFSTGIRYPVQVEPGQKSKIRNTKAIKE